MKRKFSAILATLLAVGSLVGCGNVADDTTTAASQSTETTTVETTTVETTTQVTTEMTTEATTETTTVPEKEELQIIPLDISDFPYIYNGWDPVPLLVIKVNFRNVTCVTKDDTYWYDLFFGEKDNSLKSYYLKVSDGNFHFYPATETYTNSARKNVAGDGIVEVTVNMDHSSGSEERVEAIRVADEYVDYASFDKNGNGRIEKTELAIVFIGAGYEKTRTSDTPNVNAHYQSTRDNWYATLDGVKVLAQGGGFVKVGEMMSGGNPLTVGSFAHEFTHYLGAGDLYVTSGQWGGSNSPAGGATIMGSRGSRSANNDELIGSRPAYPDAYHLTHLNLYDYTTIGSGEYTLYSRQSTEGKFNILRLNTPNLNEYYLIENRYFDESSYHFDSDLNAYATQGVVIWHVDATIADGNMTINAADKGTPPGLCALAPRKEGAEPVFTANPGVFGEAGLVFDCHDYNFPNLGTWYTCLTEEEAALMNLKIEILDDAGHEIRIRVIDAYEDGEVETYLSTASEETVVSVTGKILDLGGKTLNGMWAEIALTDDFAEVLQAVALVPGEDGSFAFGFKDLTPGTKYYVRVVYDCEGKEFYKTDFFYTRAIPVVDTVNYTVTLYRNRKDNDRSYSLKAKVNEPVIIPFSMTKDGYVFVGWYLDEAFTQYFEVSKGQESATDINLYARWVKTNSAAKLTVVGATLVNNKLNPAGYGVIGETFHEPIPAAQAGKTFVGWYADEALTKPFDFNKIIVSNNNVLIYAKWE